MAPILKPSRLDRAVAQHAKRTTKAAEKRAADRRAQLAWDLTRSLIYSRDQARCRVCDRLVMFRTSQPLDLAHVHHLVYRSAGGSDETSNLILLCARCHDDEHRHVIAITGDGDGVIEVTR